MSNELAIETLLVKRETLMNEKIAYEAKINEEIRDLDHAIAALNNGKFIFPNSPERYDDENPNYIKGSIED